MFSLGAVEVSRFIAGLDGVVGESREALRLAALAAMDALEQGHQYALLSEYAGCIGQGRGLEVRFPGKDEWHCALLKAAANCRKILSQHECGAYTVPRTPLVAVFSGDDVHIYLQRNFNAEHVIAERWAQLFIMNREKPMQGISSEFLGVICRGNYSQADEHQKKAVQSAVRNHFTFITGGPGTGKTTVLAKILLLELKRNPELQFVLCAPTGKGQARISESLNAELEDLSKVVVDSGSGRTVADECKDALERLKNPECSTVHSLLGRYHQGEMP
ncbi:MAG: AAA family ATPase [Victivallales bacterium]|nr:AAA family ATPase [Victivallales bacterium]